MIAVDSEFFEIISKSHSIAVRALIFNGVTATGDALKVTQGSITADRSQRARRSINCTMALNTWEDLPLDVIASRIQVALGVYNGFKIIWVPVGVFRVEDLARVDRGSIAVTGTSLEVYVIDDIFEKTRVFAKGVSCINTIKTLVTESLPDAIFETAAEAPSGTYPVDYPLDAAVTIDRDRWEAIEALSTKIYADVYTGPDGKFRIRSKKRLINSPAIGQIKEGKDGVLMKMNTRVSRDETYNAVLAMGQSSNPDIPPVSDWVKDTDPSSPTRWGGPFGRKTYVYENSLLTTKALCTNQGKLLLERLKSQVRTVDFSAVPNAAIEPDDVLNIDMLDGSVEKHMIGTFTIPIGIGEWTAQTLSARVADPLPAP